MSLIEHAAKRLEQLRKAGIEVHSPAASGEAPASNSGIPPNPQVQTAPASPQERSSAGTTIPSAAVSRNPDGKNTLLTSGIYLSQTYQINENLLLTDGIRVGFSSLKSTFIDTTFFQFPFSDASQQQPLYSGSIGLINTPSNDLKLSVLFSTGFRTPNVDDLAKVFETVKGTVIVPNSDLKPEKTINTEMGITKWFGTKASWENNVYYTQFIDAIVTDNFQYQGKDSIFYQGVLSKVTANQNKGKAYIYGFTSSVNNQFTENFSTEISMNYTLWPN